MKLSSHLPLRLLIQIPVADYGLVRCQVSPLWLALESLLCYWLHALCAEIASGLRAHVKQED